jgi:putative intracellular protease/amidase
VRNAKILMICTSHAALGTSGKATGVWSEELTTPYYAFIDAGAKVDVASIQGGEVPIEPNSCKALGENTASVERYLKDRDLQARLNHSLPIAALDWTGYDAFFLPGGHGVMWDLPTSETLARLLSAAYANDRIIAAVCHGPAGLVNVKTPEGTPLVAGKRVTAFTNSEEQAVGLSSIVPFLLETSLRALDARFEHAPDFRPFAVVDDRLVTGQNPASSELVAQHVLDLLVKVTNLVGTNI